MSNSTLWWLLAGAAVALELLSGTVYLLLIGVAFAAAAISAHLGGSLTVQLLVAAIVGVALVLLWYARQRRHADGIPAQARRDLNLDVGEQVQIDAWEPDGTAFVRHRGALWTAVARPGTAALTTGMHRIVALDGSRLVVEKI